MFYARVKHIEIDFHFVCNKVASKNMLVCFIYTKYQKADIFTKPAYSTLVQSQHYGHLD
jgi:citrate lyase synthetase